MRDAPQNLDTTAVVEALRRGWGFDAVEADYAAVGAGSYHWRVVDEAGLRRFATVDELNSKLWLGDTRDERFDGLGAAFATAVALRDVGLEFVVAPLPGAAGTPLERLDENHSIALFPFIEGEAREWGPYDDEDDRRAVVHLLAELHRVPAGSAASARLAGLELPGRSHLDHALRDRNVVWNGGPLSEPARMAISDSSAELTELLALADRLAAEAASHDRPWVVTHGEPHQANVIRTPDRHVLVDWDTVALAPPERDLWLVVEDGMDAELYERESGRLIDETALDFFRVTWDLKDIAEDLNVLRAPHTENEDTLTWYRTLTRCREVHERWSALMR